MQEFAIKLFEALEDKMKGIKGVEGSINDLVEGVETTKIECLNVDFQSEKDESIRFIHLQVMHCDNIMNSLEVYTRSQMMIDENKYDTDTSQFGK